MIDDIQRIRDEARNKLSSVDDLTELDRLRVQYLGKKGVVTTALKQLKDLTPEQRKEIGAVVNEARDELESRFEMKRLDIKRSDLEKELSRTEPLDVTLPGQYAVPAGSQHPVHRVIDEMVGILRKVGFSIATGPEIETEYYNFEALNTPDSHPARDVQDTFYVQSPVLLRSHTSPVQVRTMKAIDPPVQIVSFGRVYRADYDHTHTPMFHQMEGLLVDEDVSLADLKGVMHYLIRELFGKRAIRFRPSFFPFTEPSAEVDMQWNDGWLEIGGCGMVHPNVLEAAGYNPDRYMGFAFGMGIERIAMLKYGIDDLRSLFENDYRMLEQF
ncbi:MAG: phenylalanine--tRNA ligase subunit alpha [Bdellovibrionales bacterium]|nr:phenylalanine--tRNA ligase subunit alpha [Bdellovibrionales bacterium]